MVFSLYSEPVVPAEVVNKATAGLSTHVKALPATKQQRISSEPIIPTTPKQKKVLDSQLCWLAALTYKPTPNAKKLS